MIRWEDDPLAQAVAVSRQGLTVPEIAECLGLHTRTVTRHLASAMKEFSRLWEEMSE